MKVREESEKADLKLSIQKARSYTKTTKTQLQNFIHGEKVQRIRKIKVSEIESNVKCT